MANKITCTCGHSWNKSSSSKKDITICHICGKNVMKNGGWLDRYDDGGSMQEHQENYNDSDTYASPDMLGDGFSNVGRNYSPAWGGQFAMGGSLPGSVGFTYARTKDIPSNGPYAKKTKASAQNGGEMQFYQNGLDWNPKTISRDGSEIPKARNGEQVSLDDLLKVVNNKAASDNTSVKKQQRDTRTLAERKADDARDLYAKMLSQQPTLQQASSPINDERRRRLNEQYAQQSGKRYNQQTGSIEDRFTPQQDRMLNRAYENIVEPMIEGEMYASAAPLVGKGLKTAGKFITKEVDKKNIIGNIVNKSITPIGYDPFTVVAAPLELMTPKSLKFKPSTYATKNRFDSWRLYNGLEPEFNTFSKNLDGTLALNSFRLEKDQLQKIINNPKKSFGTTEIEKELNFGGVHGNGWITKGVDEQGRNFIDFTDIWDLQPLKGIKGLPKKVREFEVSSLTGGKPFGLKNRIYYDDAGNFYNSDGSKLIEEVHDFPAGVVKENEPAGLKMLSTSDVVGQKQMDVLRDWNKATNSKFNKGAATLTGGVFSGIGYLTNKEKQKLEKTKISKEKKQGGEITKDDNGYWNPENWGKPVEIGSNNITMQGVNQPLIGISDEGDVQYMQPGEDYKFKGKKVVEYPIAKEGDVIPPKTKTEYLKEKLAAQQEALQIAQDAQSMKKKDWEAKYKSVLSNDAKIKSFSGISSYDDFKNNIPTFNSRIKNYNKDLKNFEEQVAQEQSLIDQSQEPSSYIKNYLNQYNTLEDIRKAASTKYGYNPSQQLDPLQFVSNNMVKEANERISTNKGFPLYQDPTNEMTCINGVCSIAADQGVDFSNFPHGEGTGVRQDAQGRWIPQYNPTFSQNYEKAGYRILDANEAPQPGDVSQYYEGKRPHHAEIVLSRDDNKINTFNNYQLTNYGKGLSTREFDPNQDGRYDVKDQSDTKYYRLTPEAAEKAAMKNPEYSKLVEGKKKFESSDENKQYQESTKFIQNKNASLLGEDAPLFDEIVSGARGKYAKDKPGLISSLSAKSKNPKLLEKIIDQSYKNGGWLEKYN